MANLKKSTDTARSDAAARGHALKDRPPAAELEAAPAEPAVAGKVADAAGPDVREP